MAMVIAPYSQLRAWFVRFRFVAERSRKRRGVAALEFALVSVPLLLLIVGLIDYGFLFIKAQQVTQAVRVGARAAVLPDANNSKAQAAINAVMSNAGITTFSVVFTPADVATATSGNPIKVELTVPTDQLAIINMSLIPVPANLKATASMAKEGP